jgi:hypothetical protein
MYLLILVGVVIAMLIPFDLVIAPRRELKIIDSKGNPIGNAMVRRIWYKYSHEPRDIEIPSNPKGQVPLRELAVRLNSGDTILF